MKIPKSRKATEKIWNVLQEIHVKVELSDSYREVSLPLLGGLCLKLAKEGAPVVQINDCVEDRWSVIERLDAAKIIFEVHYPTGAGVGGHFTFHVHQERFEAAQSEFEDAYRLLAEFHDLKQLRDDAVLWCGNLVLDRRAQEMRFDGGAPVRLLDSSREGILLRLLIESRGNVVSYDQVCARVVPEEGWEGSVARERATQLVRDLKKKLELTGISKEEIRRRLVTREGYALRC